MAVSTLSPNQITQLPSPRGTATPDQLVSQGLAVVAMLVGVVLVVYATRRWMRRSPMLAAPAANQTSRHSHSVAQSEAVDDMNELTDRLAQRLDDKAAEIERLIEEADQRLAELKRLHAELPARSASQTTVAQTVQSRAPHSPHQAVYDLADAGLTPIEIAKRLDRPTGQIELILNLRRTTIRMGS